MKKNEEKTKQQLQSITASTPSNKNTMDVTKNANSWFVDIDLIQEEQCTSMQKRKISQEHIEDEFHNHAHLVALKNALIYLINSKIMGRTIMLLNDIVNHQ